MVGLALCPGPGWEFYFNIQKINGGDDTEDTIWDALQVKNLTQRDDREKMRGILLLAAGHLIGSAKPSQFVMATRDPDLPESALEKYLQLCHVFTCYGYDVTRANSYHGRHLWCMEQNSANAIESP
jgi:hypothetical protein